MSVVAIDRQGRRSTLAFSLVAEQDSDRLIAKRINPLEGVDVGGYHALVIGNQDYETLPDLDTAVADAEAVSSMLREKFGYKVTLLLNADRTKIGKRSGATYIGEFRDQGYLPEAIATRSCPR